MEIFVQKSIQDYFLLKIIKISSCVTAGPLDRPVFCELGKLYNKDSVIELLLDRKRAEIAAQAEEKSKSKKHKKVLLMIMTSFSRQN